MGMIQDENTNKTSVHKKPSQNFQVPMNNANSEPHMSNNVGNASKALQSVSNTNMPYIMTPGYENNSRMNLETMNQSMYQGESGMFNPGTPSRGGMNEFGNSYYQGIIPKSPFLQSPSLAYRNMNGFRYV